ncbi:MAG: N-acetylmuramoyl-L-alanine amidase [Alphaproteobacteria bacterium]|nr:N-acetylmuramoyl-L-alanine amidase [Alphaproteobacteria bacterium]
MKVRERPSPNFNDRAAGVAVDTLVLHYTGMPTAEGALERLVDPRAEVSAHYFIDEEGTVLRLVPETRRAWHAGKSSWCGVGDINSRSIGIELVNPGHDFGYRPFSEPQIVALEELAGEILSRHRIPARRILGHSDIAPDRKRDPGEMFPWARLAEAGIGLYPESWQDKAPLPGDRDLSPLAVAEIALLYIGYEVEITGIANPRTSAVIAAFQRHFVPDRVTGVLDEATSVRLNTVAKLVALDRGDPWADF